MHEPNIPSINFDPLQALSAQAMKAVDDEAVKMGLRVQQMMELSGWQMAQLIRLNEGSILKRKISVLAGKGNNGGDAMACARFLANAGAEITVICPPDVNNHGNHQLSLLNMMDISIYNDIDVYYQPDVVIDGIIGYSISGEVRSPYVAWIKWLNDCQAQVYSFDIPSGLDPNDGSVHGLTVKANHTLTLAYPKLGLFSEKAKEYVGKLYLGDVGIPRVVYEKVLKTFPRIKYLNPFVEGSLVRIKTN